MDIVKELEFELGNFFSFFFLFTFGMKYCSISIVFSRLFSFSISVLFPFSFQFFFSFSFLFSACMV